MLEKRLDALEKELTHIKKMILECADALNPYFSESRRREVERRHLEDAIKPYTKNRK
jgi:hypothetical protein